MDNAHAHPASPASSGHHSTIRLRRHSPLNPPEQTPSRQQRLLEGRNARFTAKKLSMSDLGAKFTQFIHSNEEPQGDKAVRKNQENLPTKQRKSNSIGKGAGSTRSFGILQEISSSTRSRKIRKRGSIPLYQDNQERPLLDCSPQSSPVIYRDIQSATGSPVSFDNFHDNLSTMQLREVSGNENRGSPTVDSSVNGSLKAIRKRKYASFKPAFDTQEYIEHIEQELQQAKEDMFSPRTNRSLRDQLKNLRIENDRLKTELSSLRGTFESEVKRAVEHKMAVEAELMMKVRDLEEELDRKNLTIHELEHNHEHRRVDSNTVETFKSMIERLEREKLAIEDENKNMSKRNEVLSELLAMSPTKSQSFFELRSPVRTKRSGRPMSMILPRLPSSPTFKSKSQSPSVNTSPSLSIAQPLKLSLDEVSHALFEDKNSINGDYAEARPATRGSMNSIPMQSKYEDDVDQDSEVFPQIPSSPPLYNFPQPLSQNNDGLLYKPPLKRKPRKFVSGSTQLKALLLPTLNVETNGLGMASNITSPEHFATRDFSQDSFDPTTYFLTQPSTDSVSETERAETFEVDEVAIDRTRQLSDSKYQTFEEILMETKSSSEEAANHSGLAISLEDSPCPLVHAENMRTDIADDVDKRGQRRRTMPMSPYAFRQRLEEASSAQRSSSEASIVRTVNSATLSDSLDLVTLEQLEFVELDSDYFSRPELGLSHSALVDVPEPLFSPISRNTHQARLSESLPRSNAIFNNPFLPPPITLHIQQSLPDVRDLASLPIPKPYTIEQAHITLPISTPNSALPSLHDEEQGIRTSRRSSMHTATSTLRRPKNPLEIMKDRRFGARPLAALTIRTIYGTLSQCTTYVRDFKQDPLALARRVIANAWFANWTRFGKLSWWVLGLFVTPARQQTLLGWDWDQYDAESIAQEAHEINSESSLQISHRQGDVNPTHTTSHESNARISTEEATTNNKLGWGASLFLWGKFSVAIMLAVGGAVVKGPGEMLKDMEHRQQGPPRFKNRQSTSKYATGIDSIRTAEATCSPRLGQEYNEQQGSSQTIDSNESNSTTTTILDDPHTVVIETAQLLRPETPNLDYGTIRPARHPAH